MNMTLLVLAAGIGSRYGGLKQMDPVGPSGEFLIDYSIYDAIRAGFNKVVFVIRRSIETDFRERIGKGLGRNIETEFVFQELTDLPDGFEAPDGRSKPWGTAHAVLVSKKAVREPFCVINADDFYGRQSYEVVAGFLRGTAPAEPIYSVVGFTLRGTLSEHGSVARGICEADKDGFLTSVAERTRIEKSGTGARFALGEDKWSDLTGDELVSMNMWGFTPRIFDQTETAFRTFLSDNAGNPKAEMYIPIVVDDVIKQRLGTVRVLKSDGEWFGVTYPADKSRVVEKIGALIASGEYPSNVKF
ncbi:MAG: nucleotidyltransferase [Lentisphaerales bacterium]|jgi:NDP-sugar pyrophosphorylase family protein|nr:MAG: nucleotidyltransferase [Lentisphaerales bacterium]